MTFSARTYVISITLLSLTACLLLLSACADDESPDGDESNETPEDESDSNDADEDFDVEFEPDADIDIDIDDNDNSNVESERETDSSDAYKEADAERDSPNTDGDADTHDSSEIETELPEEEIDIEIDPSSRLAIALPSRMAVGQSINLKAWISNSGQSSLIDVSRFVNWTASVGAQSVQIDNDNKTLKALSANTVFLEAAYSSKFGVVAPASGEIEIMPRSKVEARGLWVNRWAFNSAQSVRDIINKAADAGFNQVYFQVRGVFDAYYNSDIEPWARNLSGTLGGNPGWDPLQTAIEAAHSRGMELHAWINVFTLWNSNTAPPESTPRHMYLLHPEWVMENQNHVDMPLTDGYLWAAPGNPQVLSHNAAVVADIIGKYDVDGIHLDRVRYPGNQYSYDAASEAAFATARLEDPELTWLDWERSQVVRQISMIYEAIRQNAPQLALSAAVCGIYKNKWSWNSVTEGYSQWLQDTRAMTSQGVLDVAIPMIYWAIENQYGARTDFAALVDDHVAGNNGRFFYAGSDLDSVGDTRDSSNPRRSRITYVSWTQINAQIEYARNAGADGWLLYDYGTLNGADYWDELAAGPFAESAHVPQMWWKLKPVLE